MCLHFTTQLIRNNLININELNAIKYMKPGRNPWLNKFSLCDNHWQI